MDALQSGSCSPTTIEMITTISIFSLKLPLPTEIDWQDCAAGWIVGEGSDLIYEFGPFVDERSPVALAAEQLSRWAKENGVGLHRSATDQEMD